MLYVYLLQSIPFPDQRYIGVTHNFRHRLQEHNSGESPQTSRYRPWKPIVVMRFEDEHRAAEFEQYLKSGSGRAFARRHLW